MVVLLYWEKEFDEVVRNGMGVDPKLVRLSEMVYRDIQFMT